MDIRAIQKEAQKKLEVFCCYARKDRLLLQELEKHLMSLQREGLISFWVDTDMNAGVEWEKEIHFHLDTAHIILLLISPDFIASHYCYQIEMQQAIQRHERGEVCVIPIILRPAHWKNAPFAKLQALPREAKPITTWDNYDDAFLDVVEGLRKVAEDWQSSSVLIAPDPELFLSPQQSLIFSLSTNSRSLEGSVLDDLPSADTLYPSVPVSTKKEKNSIPVSASDFPLLKSSPKDAGKSKQNFRETIAYVLLGGLCLIIIVRGISSLSYPTLSDKKAVIQTYCSILVYQDYTQASTILGLSQGGVTFGKELITDQTVFEALASFVDNQKGRVTMCRMSSITRIATHAEPSPSICTSSGCETPPDEITTIFACTLQIIRREGKPYVSHLLVDVRGPADNFLSPVAYITTIEAL